MALFRVFRQFVANIGGPKVGASEWNADLSYSGELPVANGGTGAANAADARTNLGAAPIASPSFTGTAYAAEGYSWGAGGSVYGITGSGYTIESGTLRVNYIFAGSHGDTATFAAYHDPGVTSFFQMRAGANIFRFLSSGAALKLGGGTWGDTSDERTKDDIEDWEAGLDVALELRVRQWRYKPETGRDPSITYRGLVAQEAELVAPTLVVAQKGSIGTLSFPDLRYVDGSDLPYILVNAIKTLHTRLAAAEEKIKALEAR